MSTSMEGTWGCGSNFPISSITQIVAGNDALLPTGTLSSISSDFWDGTLLSSSSNISLFHDPFAIAWQESQIPTLTVWTPEGGPEGAVVSTADTAILSLYTFQFTARLYDEYPLQTTGLNSPPSHNEGKIVGLVLGIVGGVGGLSLLAFGVWLLQRRATKEQRERGNRTPQITEVEAIPPFQQQQQPPQPTLWNKIFGST